MWPLAVGLGVAATAIGAKYVIQAWEKYQAMPKRPKAKFRNFYKGGFKDDMDRREAALILGVRESATPDRIKERHRQLLMLNHPDTGGSTFIATKLNEAKDMLLKKGDTSQHR